MALLFNNTEAASDVIVGRYVNWQNTSNISSPSTGTCVKTTCRLRSNWPIAKKGMPLSGGYSDTCIDSYLAKGPPGNMY
jgi:hypothetical protein